MHAGREAHRARPARRKYPRRNTIGSGVIRLRQSSPATFAMHAQNAAKILYPRPVSLFRGALEGDDSKSLIASRKTPP
jgi:hypothetical protein